MDYTATGKHPPSMSLSALFLKFLRFGFLAFGGPVAQIAMLREALVEEERWIDRSRFNKLLAILQVLPGPEAHELCVHFGIVARGRIGGLLAGLGFMLPGFALMLLAGWIYVTWIAGHGLWSGPLLGVQIAVLAIILRAVFRIGEHILIDRLTWAIALISALLTLTNMPFWLPLIAAAAIYAFAQRPYLAIAVAIFTAGLAACLYMLPGGQAALTISHEPSTVIALFIAGLKGGLLTFGGAYTAIPYVRADTVGRGWLSDATFLDGIALAGILPAPLVIFATFVGYVSGALPGALAITAGMFLPAFAFSLIFYERLEAIVDHPALQKALEGVAAAVVGIIAATFLQLGKAAWLRVPSLPMALTLFCFALIAAWRLKGMWVTPAILVFGALVGAASSLW
ncbi:chromate transporter [Novosphingobium sp. PhB57]|jgi:chromate transporter|uniref:chromate efflux transporter n=1 Tax=Novosphingobium sp. PhB57 TaxID=2485107 RepID=UPI00104692DA|nr:chromate efflux transporter [Novosphingobium sp. PhB57]TCU54573.1 chromate transporter [Novosphingobium sp. PhB57]